MKYNVGDIVKIEYIYKDSGDNNTIILRVTKIESPFKGSKFNIRICGIELYDKKYRLDKEIGSYYLFSKIKKLSEDELDELMVELL